MKVWCAVTRMWDGLHVSHRGAFSIERLEAYDAFSRCTSTFQALLICLALPLPAFVMVLLVEFIPLQDPFLGWQNNSGAWIRQSLLCFYIAAGFVVQTSAMLPALAIRPIHVLVIGMFTSVCVMLSILGIAIAWAYPVPFSAAFGTIPFFLSMMASSGYFIGRQCFVENPNLAKDLRQHLLVLLFQGLNTVVYSVFSSTYFQLSSDQQIGFILLLPLIKISMQHAIAWSTSHIEEYIPGIIVFSIEIFNALYVGKCLQNAGSRLTFLVLILVDVVKMALTFYNMDQQTKEISLMMQRELALQPFQTKSNLLLVVLQTCQRPGVLSASKEGPFIRIRSPLDLHLSTSRTNLLARIEIKKSAQAIHRQSHQRKIQVYPLPRNLPTESLRTVSIKEPIVPDTRTIASSQEFTDMTGKVHQVKPVAHSVIRSSTVRRIFVHRTLKVLFQCEYHALVEYIEFMIPMLYAIYVVILCRLPSAAYYPETEHLTAKQAQSMVDNIIMYAFLELLSFMLLHFAVMWRFRLSLVHLLAFSIQNRFAEFQGRLLVIFAYVLPHTLTHFGVDFSMKFLWLKK